MKDPLVTVLMPVFNAERFLRRAIESVLAQTFTDFELLIINDGSTDQSVSIIQSFQDERIRLVHNKQNSGVITTLNTGIMLAKGKYIARMDADDICVADRLAKQVSYLEEHPGTAVLAAHIMQINAHEEDLGTWDQDVQNSTAAELFRTMAKTNCIAHPTIVIRKQIAQQYLYHKKQKGSEDWDLWMRLLSDGYRIEKLTDYLLKYRIHAASVTSVHNQSTTLEKKLNKVRITFLKERLRKFRFKKFECLVLLAILRTMARDIKVNRLPKWLRFWKRLLTLSPFRAYQEFQLLKRTIEKTENLGGLFFFFPYTHVGGAEKVHAQITETVKDKNPWIFFTGFSLNKKFLPMFENNGTLLDVAVGINHPFFIKRSMKLIAECIEKSNKPVIFGCNNLFFYDLIPVLSNNVKVIDLMHDFRFDGEEMVFKSFLPKFLRCDHRVFISERAIQQTKKFYRMNSVEEEYVHRLVYIPNYTDVPAHFTEKKSAPLQVVYVGRDTSEKRAYLVSALAKLCLEKKMEVQFTIVGAIQQPVALQNQPAIEFTGELTDTEKLRSIYKKADVILITSEREGFPMAIMEGMAYGVIPVSTPVGDVPKHIKQGQTGYITSSLEADMVVAEMSNYIQLLLQDKTLRQTIGKNAHAYALLHFSKEQFTKRYQELLKYDRNHLH
jgi:glycosyltransferase involved in cell wall biosynthesis